MENIELVHQLLKFPFEWFLGHAATMPFLYVLLSLLGAFAILGQWVMYYKCDLPGIASIVPIWNVVVFLRIMGRPKWQSIFFLVPPPLIFIIVYTGNTSLLASVSLIVLLLQFVIFVFVVYIELCKCFGKNNIAHYLACLMLNGLYVMYLGMSGNSEYSGPLYGELPNTDEELSPA
ncbi:MAG: hypothetical protein KDC37_00980 [Flavobacteriales bacterium]|jgi:hypothetical protein|nr:hypothetical protein [Flavobacteriales bacterium]